MRILVTGAAGYVGSLLTERLAENARVDRVVATDVRSRAELSAAVFNGKLNEESGRL
jgi:nucleoside-diphosphate-sugar epimerase